MNHVTTGRFRPARLLAAVFLALVTGAAVISAAPASAASKPTPPGPVSRPCPILRTARPCPPCPFVPYPRLRPCPPVPVPEPGPVVPGLLEAKDFSAFVNRQPLAPPKLIVTGTLVFGSPGFSPVLVAAQPQGINPDIALLNLVVTRSDLFQPQIVTEVPVRFESTDLTGVSEVNILELALQIPVTVVR